MAALQLLRTPPRQCEFSSDSRAKEELRTICKSRLLKETARGPFWKATRPRNIPCYHI